MNGRDWVYQLGRQAYQRQHQREPFHYDACPDIICSLFLRQTLPSLRPQPLGSLLATPTPCWQHRIGPPSAFPQQLQVSRTLRLLPSTFLSTKTNESSPNELTPGPNRSTTNPNRRHLTCRSTHEHFRKHPHPTVTGYHEGQPTRPAATTDLQSPPTSHTMLYLSLIHI